MGLTISDAGIVVNIVRETRSPSQKGFGAVLFLHSVVGGITDRIKLYTSLSGVAVDFQPTDEAYLSAQSYFSQSPAPQQFYVGQVDETGLETYVEALDACTAVDPDFYCVTLETAARDDVAVVGPVAGWVEASERIFFNVSNDLNCTVPADTTDIMSALQLLGYDRTLTFYQSVAGEFIDSGAFAILATTSYRGTNTLKTLKFKDVAGVTSENIDPSQLKSIQDKNGNVLFTTATIRMIDAGRTAAGSWIDEVVGTDALAEEIRVRVFGLLSRVSTKIPYNEKGMGLLEGEVKGSLEQYVTNGFLTSSIDSEGNIVPAYTVGHTAVALASVADKSARIAPDIEFEARLAGAIHDITISGTLKLD